MFKKEDIYKYLYFDVETAALYKDLETLHDANPRLWQLWKKREAYYLGAYPALSAEDPEAIYKQKAGLEPEFSRVVCVSFGSFTDTGEVRFASFYGDDEHDILTKTAKVLNNAASKNWKLCGHNIKGFDVPCLGKRMIYNGINPPANIRIWDKKPWEIPYVDTSDVFAFGSWTHQKYLSLDLLSCSLGIESPKGIMDGSKVNDSFWIDKDYENIKTYCELDVSTVMEVMLKVCFPS
jgi:predicted PolB exonuclease-like 3'-5' exonuclease